MARMKSLTGSDLPCYRIVKVNKILVSQPKPASDKSPYYDIARKYGVEVVFRPFIKVEGLSAREFRQQKININDFTAVISRHVRPLTISSAFARRCASLCPTQ